MRRFELVEGSSSKFWEIAVESSATTVRFGRLGTEGRTQTRDHGSTDEAEKACLKLIAEKTGKGYQEVTSAAATPAPVKGAASPRRATPSSSTPLLSPADEKKLLAKLVKAEDADAATKLLAKAAPRGDVPALLADLARRQKLGLEAGVVELLQRHAGELDPAAIHTFFDTFGDECVGEPGSDYPVVRGFGREELVALARSYEKHPGYWDGCSASRALEGCLALVRARAGRAVDAAVRERVLGELVDGVVTLADLPGNAYLLGITPEDWGRKTLPVVLAAGTLRPASMAAAADALVQAPWRDVRPILAGCPRAGRVIREILSRRADAPRDLLAFADEESFEIDDFGYVVMAVLPRIAAAGLPLPDAWDESLTSTVVHFKGDRSGLAESFAGAERAISVARRHGILRAALAANQEDGSGHWAYALLRHAWDEALFAQALAGLKDKPHLKASNHHDESESLGLVGARALPLLARELEAARRTPETGLASHLWQALLVAATATAEAGALDSRYLELVIEPGFSMGPLEQFGQDRYWKCLLQALPRERARSIVDAWRRLPASHDRAERCCVPDELRNGAAG